jgi:hypothetical protein
MQFNPSVNSPIIDYSAAVAGAVAWLGNRYLLATPARRLNQVERYTDPKSEKLVSGCLYARRLKLGREGDKQLAAEDVVNIVSICRTAGHDRI